MTRRAASEAIGTAIRPDIVQRCRQEEFEIMASSPEELGTLLASEVRKYTKLVKERSMRLD